MFVPDLLVGKRILITGGGSGLGKSIGERFMSLGAKELIICGRRLEVLEQTASKLQGASGIQVTPIQCDVRNADAVEKMMDRIWQDGPLNILLNNAAGNFSVPSERLSPRAIDAVLDIVLHGTIYCTVAAGRRWIKGGDPGTVLSVVSSAALLGYPFQMSSAAAKAGVLAMTKTLAVEWAPRRIRLVAVAPGLFPTPGAWQRLYPEGIEFPKDEDTVPAGRVGRHAELADLCSFLVSDQASYITGEHVMIDGGRSLWGGSQAGTRTMQNLSAEQWDKVIALAKSKGD